MSHRNGITGARANEVTREADVEVIWAHTRQLELLSHVGLTQQGVQDHPRGPTTRRMAAQTTTTSSPSAKPMSDSLRLRASCCRRVKTHAAGREETIVPNGR